MRKKLSHMILELHNVRMKLSNVSKKKITIKYEKKIRVSPNVTKVWLKVILILHNVRIESLNMRKNK